MSLIYSGYFKLPKKGEMCIRDSHGPEHSKYEEALAKYNIRLRDEDVKAKTALLIEKHVAENLSLIHIYAAGLGQCFGIYLHQFLPGFGRERIQ